jgi:hypothetical protein
MFELRRFAFDECIEHKFRDKTDTTVNRAERGELDDTLL